MRKTHLHNVKKLCNENFSNSSMKRPQSSANILCDQFIVANVDISFPNMLFLFAYASSLCHTLQIIRKCVKTLILIELNYSDSKGASANEPCYRSTPPSILASYFISTPPPYPTHPCLAKPRLFHLYKSTSQKPKPGGGV